MQLKSNMTEFILLGLTQDPVRKKIVFVIFLIFYLGTLLDNLLIIVTVKTSWALGKAPRMIADTLLKKTTISFSECMIQVFAFHFLFCLEIFILILMTVDHYVAICKLLHYTTIMSHRVCGVLMFLAWLGSCVHSSAQIFLVLGLPFCGPSGIDHYFCDLQPLLQLACTDTYVTSLHLVLNSGAICTVSFIMLIAEGSKKALSTCISHIMVTIFFFGPCIFIYTRPATTFCTDKMIAVLYTIGTPLFNPLIYTLRNAEVKKAMRTLWSKKLISDDRR
ncbi:hypothetical protein FD754_008081 [Muntiacus muntjak]|uniref:G-protein coupled receptors family 1 profile domain-containing protein n=1 Tax=Muntiacus muntjak TaxID=9888 RepID=A0A5N3WT33_MUNMU|nr:hypothetical protein FD754_008081 [Muntiacus muntjak]